MAETPKGLIDPTEDGGEIFDEFVLTDLFGGKIMEVIEVGGDDKSWRMVNRLHLNQHLLCSHRQTRLRFPSSCSRELKGREGGSDSPFFGFVSDKHCQSVGEGATVTISIVISIST